MSMQVRTFQPTIPANTPIATPFTQQMSMPSYNVDRIRVKVPAGPRGTMGFAIGSSGFAVIPYVPNTWIIADNDDLLFELDNYWDSGSWEFFGYNLGQFPHTVYLTFELSRVPPPAPRPVSPVSSLVLSSPQGPVTTSAGAAPSTSPTGTAAVAGTPAPEPTPIVPAPPTGPPLPPIVLLPLPPITVPTPPV